MRLEDMPDGKLKLTTDTEKLTLTLTTKNCRQLLATFSGT